MRVGAYLYHKNVAMLRVTWGETLHATVEKAKKLICRCDTGVNKNSEKSADTGEKTLLVFNLETPTDVRKILLIGFVEDINKAQHGTKSISLGVVSLSCTPRKNGHGW